MFSISALSIDENPSHYGTLTGHAGSVTPGNPGPKEPRPLEQTGRRDPAVPKSGGGQVTKFRHSGRIGDIIYSLPTVRAMGGGELYLHLEPGLGFTQANALALIPLLTQQNYITKAKIWEGELFDVDLDKFREGNRYTFNLADAHLESFLLPKGGRDQAWLEVGNPERICSAVFARSLVRRGPLGFWEKAYEVLGHCAGFAGSREEHRQFERLIGAIPHYETADFLELAKLIAGAEIFVGNQSAPYAVAEGLKAPAIQERYRLNPNCVFDRKDCISVGTEADIELIQPFAERLAPVSLAQARPWEDAALSLVPASGGRIGVIHPDPERGCKLVNDRFVDAEATSDIEDTSGPLQAIVCFASRDPEQVIAAARRHLVEDGRLIAPLSASKVFADNLWRTVDQSAWHFKAAYQAARSGHLAAQPIRTAAGPNIKDQLGAPTISGASVVVLTFNSATMAGYCLKSLLPTLGEDDELIVVDNGSEAQTIETVQGAIKSAPNARLIENKANLGFSAGCNVGLRAAGGATLVLLNPDTTVRPGWLDSFKARLSRPEVGAVGPTSDSVAGLQFVSSHLDPSDKHRLTPDQLAKRLRQLHPNESLETKLLIGFCVGFRREVLNEVGLLDEDLFLGGEDLEMSIRLRAGGYKLLIAQDVFVHHSGGESFRDLGLFPSRRLLAESTAVLHEKLRAFFAPGPVPSSMDLFGIDILPKETPEAPRQQAPEKEAIHVA